MTPQTDLDTTIRSQNLTTWLELEALKKGTDNQRERWNASVLPEDELLQLARHELFAGFDGFARWHTNEVRRDMRSKLRHQESCASRVAVPEFEVAELAELGAAGWDVLKKISLVVSRLDQHEWMARQHESATVETFTHWATCISCQSELCRSGAKVSIPWAGRVLVREFAL